MHEQDTEKYDKRLIRLEEDSCFQEEKLSSLDQQIHSQQLQLDQLERQVRDLRSIADRLRELANSQPLNGKRFEPDPLPPHYQSKDWHE